MCEWREWDRHVCATGGTQGSEMTFRYLVFPSTTWVQGSQVVRLGRKHHYVHRAHVWTP